MILQDIFKKQKQFIPFVTCGFPTKSSTLDIIKLFLDEGVEIVEIGIPFSDPVADGPTIQYSSFIALQKKINIDDVFEVVDKTLRYKKYFPVLMTYLNPVIIYGIEKFFKKASQIGISGVIFADSIVEHRDIFYSLTKNFEISSIFLLSTTTSLERRKLIYKYTTGFIYLITLTGTTGARKSLPNYFYEFVQKVRKETQKPLCAGFGISSPRQVIPILNYVDGVIVGSAIVEKIKEGNLKSLKNFIKEFLEVLK